MRRLNIGSPPAGNLEAKLEWCIRALREVETASHDISVEEISDNFTATNVTVTRTIDADATTLAKLADVFCTYIDDQKNRGAKRTGG